jgi:hypothetical protein
VTFDGKSITNIPLLDHTIGAVIDTGTTLINIDPITFKNLQSGAEKKGITFSPSALLPLGSWTQVTCNDDECSDFPALNFTF